MWSCVPRLGFTESRFTVAVGTISSVADAYYVESPKMPISQQHGFSLQFVH